MIISATIETSRAMTAGQSRTDKPCRHSRRHHDLPDGQWRGRNAASARRRTGVGVSPPRPPPYIARPATVRRTTARTNSVVTDGPSDNHCDGDQRDRGDRPQKVDRCDDISAALSATGPMANPNAAPSVNAVIGCGQAMTSSV